jgi:hypothetical protein
MSEKSGHQINGYATASDILGKPKSRRFKDIEVSGNKFKLRNLFAGEVSDWLSTNERRPKTINERLIVLTVVDGEGNPIFSAKNIKELQQLDGAFIAELAKLSMSHCGIDSLDDLEDEAKN